MELLELMGSVSYGLKMIMLGEKKATSNEWEISSLIAKEIPSSESHIPLSLQRASGLSRETQAAAADNSSNNNNY